MFKKTAIAALGASTVFTVLQAVPAHAEATANVSVGTQFGNVLRGQFRQNVDGSGYFFRTYGSDNCTVDTGNVDSQIADMSAYSWDNAASYAQDYASCDTKLYRYAGPSTALTGWINYGSGQTLSGALNNLTTAFQLS
jgi:hypothetical protein